MRRRCFPVRGDHKLLTPETHTQSGVQLSHVTQVKLEHGPSHLAHLNDLYSSDRAAGTTAQRLAASPGRRLRFEDETEMEAESRYQERRRRQVGTHRTGLLVSKPDLNLYVNGRTGMGPQVDNQCHICRTGARDRSNVSQHPPVAADGRRSSYRTPLNLWTEPIRETYIGSVTQVETRRGGAACPSNMQVRRTTNLGKDDQMTYIIDLPVNPYATDQTSSPTASLSPVTSSITSLTVRLNDTKEGQNVNQKQEVGRPAVAQLQCVLKAKAELTEQSPCMDLQSRKCTSSYLPAQVEPMMMSQLSQDLSADSQTPSRSSSDWKVKQPIRAELHSDVRHLPEQDCSKDESSHLHLRRLFSNIRLSWTESRSLDQLTLSPSPPANRKTSSLLKKSPSAQSLSVGLPFSKLRKSSSVQSFGSEPKKKDRSADYRRVSDRFLPRTLSIEHVGHPGSSYSVGRVLQVCSDGTFDLELIRPESGTFEFTLSRGRADSGVYVEDILDHCTEKLYSGLLSIGDKILEVNGKNAAALSLDQITLLLTQNPAVMLRILRLQKTPP